MRVLIVEDDEDQLAVRSMLISHLGFETEGARDAHSARTLADSNTFDLAVVDINLPLPQAGLELLAYLKAVTPGIRLIVMTGTNPEKLQHHPEMKLADEIILKGASAKPLVASLKRLSEQRVA